MILVADEIHVFIFGISIMGATATATAMIRC
jgi:hypothetical protein